MIKMLPIPSLKDNYIWLIIHTASQRCMIVDPGDDSPVIAALQKYSLKPVALLITHHHWDHTRGINELVSEYSLPVFGYHNEPIPGLTQPLNDGELVQVEDIPFTFQAIAIPGHTLGHCAYYNDSGIVFTGDILFTGGCGRIFEGTPEQMYTSLTKLANLPTETLIYCGHEYTEQNLRFALAVEPDNQTLLERMAATIALRKQSLPTVPASLALEKMTNPFLRCHTKSVIQAAEKYCRRKLSAPLEVFTIIREWKNQYQ